MPSLVPPSSPLSQSPRTVLRRSTSDLYLASAGNDAAVLQNGVHNMHTSGSGHSIDPFNQSGRRNHARHLTDTGYQSRGLYGSQDFHQPPTTHTPLRYDPNDSHSHDRVLNEPGRLGHFSDTDSVDDENMETFQGMLAFVNHQIASQQRLHDSTARDDFQRANLNLSGVSGKDAHSFASTTQENSELTLNLSELQEGRGEGEESPRKARVGTRGSPGKLGSRSRVSPSSRDGTGRSPGKSSSLGHRPKIMQSPGNHLIQSVILMNDTKKYKSLTKITLNRELACCKLLTNLKDL